MDWNKDRNLTMLVDFYELTMANGYLQMGMQDKRGVFDMFFRRIPDRGGFAIAAGLEQVIDYLKNLKFTEEDIEYLRGKNLFGEDFLDWLRDFKFSCDGWAVPEGTPIFPNEPILIVEGPIMEAQLIETMILLTINFQSLIATKASRIVRAAEGRPVMEFGSRRAQSYDAAVLGARASYIAGCSGTACAIADREYGTPALGTMAHSWVQLFDNEYDAFKAYAEVYPSSCTLLVDTYNVLKSGIPNAIKVFNEVLAPKGFRPKGVRIDSGDIAYLSKKARKMLDDAGYPDCAIVASNSLDEYLIRDLLRQGAQLNSFGVGENLITSKSDPVFGGVYKLVAVEENGVYAPRIKLSETVEKITTPCKKMVYRLYSTESGEPVADYIAMYDEEVPATGPITLFDPANFWKSKEFDNVELRPILKRIFDKGECCYESPSIEEIRAYCLEQVGNLWDEVKRFENPHLYYVDLSEALWTCKQVMLSEHNIK
ncbi:MAG: nicotinate phosphoribosyltransferase [Oscillospiraceae bacterium]|nr:nicotinate phosphoribosyltransferase [Oscillospiraceae bacterium]